MNSSNIPSPLVTQGSLLEQKNKGRSRVRLAVFCVLAIHVVGLLALLMQGCKREQAPPPEAGLMPPLTETNLPPVVDTNLPPAVASNVPPPVVDTAPPPAVGGAQEYVIQKGDSF